MVATSHLDGRYRVEVRVNPQARKAFSTLTPGGVLEVGTTVVASHRLDEDGSEGPVFVMEKPVPGRWRFLMLDPSGRVVAADVSLCERCHVEAPADWHFPLAHRPAEGAADAGL